MTAVQHCTAACSPHLFVGLSLRVFLVLPALLFHVNVCERALLWADVWPWQHIALLVQLVFCRHFLVCELRGIVWPCLRVRQHGAQLLLLGWSEGMWRGEDDVKLNEEVAFLKL